MFWKKEFMSWEKYAKLISEIEHIRFIDQTFRQSLVNERWQNERY